MIKKLFFASCFLAFAGSALFAADKDTDGWVALFDGKTLNGWVQHGGKAKYVVEAGELVGSSVPNTSNSFLCTEREFGNFVLELEFRVDAGLNSGVQIRSHCYTEPKEYEWQSEKKKVTASRVNS